MANGNGVNGQETAVERRGNSDVQITRPEDALVRPLKENAARITALLGGDKNMVAQIQSSVLLACAENDYLIRVAMESAQGMNSLILCVFRASRMGFRIFSGPFAQAYLVPFAGKITLIPAYKGLIDKAYDCGAVKALKGAAVYESDEFDFMDGTEPYLHHRKSLRPGGRGQFIGAWCSTVLPTGEKTFTVLPADDVHKIRDEVVFSKIRGDRYKTVEQKIAEAPWTVWFDQMATKTAIRSHANQLPLNPDRHVDFTTLLTMDDRAVQGKLLDDDERLLHEAGRLTLPGSSAIDRMDAVITSAPRRQDRAEHDDRNGHVIDTQPVAATELSEPARRLVERFNAIQPGDREGLATARKGKTADPAWQGLSGAEKNAVLEAEKAATARANEQRGDTAKATALHMLTVCQSAQEAAKVRDDYLATGPGPDDAHEVKQAATKRITEFK